MTGAGEPTPKALKVEEKVRAWLCERVYMLDRFSCEQGMLARVNGKNRNAILV